MNTDIETARAQLIGQEFGLPAEYVQPWVDEPLLHAGTVLSIELEFEDGSTQNKTIVQPMTMPVRAVNHILTDAAELCGAVAGMASLSQKGHDGLPQTLSFGTDISRMKAQLVRHGLLEPECLKRGFGK